MLRSYYVPLRCLMRSRRYAPCPPPEFCCETNPYNPHPPHPRVFVLNKSWSLHVIPFVELHAENLSVSYFMYRKKNCLFVVLYRNYDVIWMLIGGKECFKFLNFQSITSLNETWDKIWNSYAERDHGRCKRKSVRSFLKCGNSNRVQRWVIRGRTLDLYSAWIDTYPKMLW